MIRVKNIITIVCFIFSFQVIAQFDIPEKPDFQTSVYDYINLLSHSNKSALEEKLIRYSDSTSTQIVVAIINSTQGEEINYLGANWAHEWGIGQEKEDNGIFILLAHGDRRIGINTGYGVEHLLTDAMSKRIIESNIIPYFKNDDYYGGLNSGVDAIFRVMNGEYRNNTTQSDFPVWIVFVFLFIIFIFILIIISIVKKGGGGRSGGKKHSDTSLLEAIILSRAGRGSYSGSGKSSWGGSSGSSWGGSSGGFGGGFGGGGFGGGGASGGW